VNDIVACQALFRGDVLMHVEFARDSDCYVLPVLRHVIGDAAPRDNSAHVIPTLDAKVSHVIDYHRQRGISFVDVFYQGALHPVT